ncbi:hypothetical protein AB1Y20_015390 [Prymnesium parvum]|uniref:Uncharacterized protein n=1 Tax=Prymnesium parvum TaxID=97485 RepID=A0AB34K0M1_PRYPA
MAPLLPLAVLAFPLLHALPLAAPSSLTPPLTRARCTPSHPARARPCMSDPAGGALARLDASLEQALSSLPADEKYNAVLESLISRGGSGTLGAIYDVVDEMNAKRIRLSDGAVKALVDCGVRTTDARLVLQALVAGRANGALRTFASPQARLSPRPSDGALAALADVPMDDSLREVAAAVAFLMVAGGVLLAELADLVDFLLPGDSNAPPAQIFLVGLAAGWGVDRYTQQGRLFETVGRGLSRLFERDLQRESATESASFLVGYLLGLPCLAFSPAAFKPLEMVAASAEQLAALASGGSPRLLDRLLVWLMAPVAVESLQYRQTLRSDPQLPLSLLKAARRREATLGIDPNDGGWTREQDEERVKWALAEARALLKRYSGLREEIQERMVSGVSAGECVLLIERRLKNQWGAI